MKLEIGYNNKKKYCYHPKLLKQQKKWKTKTPATNRSSVDSNIKFIEIHSQVYLHFRIQMLEIFERRKKFEGERASLPICSNLQTQWICHV